MKKNAAPLAKFRRELHAQLVVDVDSSGRDARRLPDERPPRRLEPERFDAAGTFCRTRIPTLERDAGVACSWQYPHMAPTPNDSSDLRFVSDSYLGRFESDLDFGQFNRLARSVAFQNTIFDRPKPDTVSTTLKNQRNCKSLLSLDVAWHCRIRRATPCRSRPPCARS